MKDCYIDLEKELKEKDQDGFLYSSYTKIKDYASDYWDEPFLYWFTDHSTEHSKRIINILGQIIGSYGTNKCILDEHELFILLSSAYLHDIGMQSLILGNNKSADKLDENDYNTIRENHANKSYIIIMKDQNKFSRKKIDKTYFEAIANVSKGHSTDYFDETIKWFNKYNISPNNNKINFQRLTALLMIADELDLHCCRVNFDKLELMNLSTESKLHWYKHHYVDSIEIKNFNININIRIPKKSEEYLELIDFEIKKKLNDQLNKANKFFDYKLILENIEPTIDNSSIKTIMPVEAISLLKKRINKIKKTTTTDTKYNEFSQKVISQINDKYFPSDYDDIKQFINIYLNNSTETERQKLIKNLLEILLVNETKPNRNIIKCLNVLHEYNKTDFSIIEEDIINILEETKKEKFYELCQLIEGIDYIGVILPKIINLKLKTFAENNNVQQLRLSFYIEDFKDTVIETFHKVSSNTKEKYITKIKEKKLEDEKFFNNLIKDIIQKFVTSKNWDEASKNEESLNLIIEFLHDEEITFILKKALKNRFIYNKTNNQLIGCESTFIKLYELSKKELFEEWNYFISDASENGLPFDELQKKFSIDLELDYEPDDC